MWLYSSLDTWDKTPFNFDVHSMLGFPLQLNSEISLYQNGVQNVPLVNEEGVGEFSRDVLIYTRKKCLLCPIYLCLCLLCL